MAAQNRVPRPASAYRPRKREGRCYELAYRFQSENPTWMLVHGEVRGPDGSRIGHAWLEGNGWVYDVVLDTTTQRDDYLARFAAVATAEYSREQAARAALASRHLGPWTDALLVA